MNLPAEPEDRGSAESATGSTPTQRPTPTVDRAALDRIFGTAPLSTRDDERDPEPARSADDWYQENRPPHHGG